MSNSQAFEVAADLIRDAAAATTRPRKPEFGWTYMTEDDMPGWDPTMPTMVCSSGFGGTDVVAQSVRVPDAQWIAMLSPAVAPAIEVLLRVAAVEDAHPSPLEYGSSSLSALMTAVRELARIVLAAKEKQL